MIMQMEKKWQETLYAIAFTLYAFMSLAGGSTLISVSTNIKFVIYGMICILLFLEFLTQEYTKKELIVNAIIFAVCALIYVKLDTIFFLMNFLFIMSVKNINIKNVVKTDIVVKCIFLVVHIVAYSIGYATNYNGIQELAMSDDGRIRHAFYFIHPNIMSSIVFWLLLDLYYLKKNMKFINKIASLIIMIVTYYFTRSRTILVLYVVCVVLIGSNSFFKNKKNYSKIISIIYKYIFDFMTVISFLIAILYKYNNNFVRKVLNPITSGRVYASYEAIKRYGVTFLYNIKALDFENNLIIDNFYIRSTVLYGMFFLLMLIIMPKLRNKDYSTNIKDKIMIIVLAISLFSEYSGIIIGNAIPLLLLGNLIMKKYKGEVND